MARFKCRWTDSIEQHPPCVAGIELHGWDGGKRKGSGLRLGLRRSGSWVGCGVNIVGSVAGDVWCVGEEGTLEWGQHGVNTL